MKRYRNILTEGAGLLISGTSAEKYVCFSRNLKHISRAIKRFCFTFKPWSCLENLKAVCLLFHPRRPPSNLIGFPPLSSSSHDPDPMCGMLNVDSIASAQKPAAVIDEELLQHSPVLVSMSSPQFKQTRPSRRLRVMYRGRSFIPLFFFLLPLRGLCDCCCPPPPTPHHAPFSFSFRGGCHGGSSSVATAFSHTRAILSTSSIPRWKGPVVDDLPGKDATWPLSISRALKLGQKRCYGNIGEARWIEILSSYELSLPLTNRDLVCRVASGCLVLSFPSGEA